MINLMPPTLKEQIRYAKLNRLVLSYVKVTIVVAIALTGVFGWALWQVGQQTTTAQQDATQKQADFDSLKAKTMPNAKKANDSLTAIKYVQDTQTRFSALIDDLAKVVPAGVAIDSLTLTGDDKSPVRIGYSATSYQAALAFRNALTTSPRISAADLESIAANSNGGFAAGVVIGFKPGMAK